MDAELHQVSILREHSEHLRKLSLKLSQKLAHLEQILAEPPSPSEMKAGSPGEGLAELNHSILAEANIFSQRLYLLLANSPRLRSSRESPPQRRIFL